MRIVAFDCETGGLDCKQHDLLTVYFCVLDDYFNVIDELDLKLKPNEGSPRVTEEAMKVTGIDLEQHLADPQTVTYSEAQPVIAKFLAKHLVNKKPRTLQPAGHNVTFDIGFLQEFILKPEYWGKFFTHRIIDTTPITNFLKLIGWWPQELGRLESIVKYLNIPLRKAHDAKADTLMFVDVLKAMVQIFKDKKSQVSGVDLSEISSIER